VWGGWAGAGALASGQKAWRWKQPSSIQVEIQVHQIQAISKCHIIPLEHLSSLNLDDSLQPGRLWKELGCLVLKISLKRSPLSN
jgi:hypothetical protein